MKGARFWSAIVGALARGFKAVELGSSIGENPTGQQRLERLP